LVRWRPEVAMLWGYGILTARLHPFLCCLGDY